MYICHCPLICGHLPLCLVLANYDENDFVVLDVKGDGHCFFYALRSAGNHASAFKTATHSLLHLFLAIMCMEIRLIIWKFVN